jgi:hypothetical protein
MNSVCESPFYEFLTKSRLLNYIHFNRNEISGQLKRSFSSSMLLKAPLIPEHCNITDQSQFKNEIHKRISSLVTTQDEIDLAIKKLDCSIGGENLYHPFNFKSAYDYYDKYGNELVTTVLPDSHESVDFIFYHVNNNQNKNQKSTSIQQGSQSSRECNASCSSINPDQDDCEENDEDDNCEMKILSTLQLFNKEQVETLFLPNKHFASDHFLLAAKFLLISKN